MTTETRDVIAIDYDEPTTGIAQLKLRAEQACIDCLVDRDRLVITTARLAKSRDAIAAKNGTVPQSWLDLQAAITAQHVAAAASLTKNAIAFVDALSAYNLAVGGDPADPFGPGWDSYAMCRAWSEACGVICPPETPETHTGLIDRDIEPPPGPMQAYTAAILAAERGIDADVVMTAYRNYITAYGTASWPVPS